MRDRHVLRAWPLTPIHVGTGELLTPESFVLDGETLRAINGFAALSRMTGPERSHYLAQLKGGDFIGAQKQLAAFALKTSVGSSESIPVGRDILGDLRAVLEGRSIGQGGIRPFARDGGAPILPGSSLKGALRTAWIDQAIAGRSLATPRDPRRTKEEAHSLNDAALDIERRAWLEQDPFRDVAVVDAPIPPGRTRYDRATLGKLERDRPALDAGQTGGIRMHVERLVSLADGGAVEPFEVEIDLASETVTRARARLGSDRDGDRRIVPAAPIGAEALWRAANRFHADLWLYERRRFYGDGPARDLLDRLLAAFGLKGESDLAGQLDAASLVLLRVGRYGQFESKAARLNGRRYGVKAGRQGNPPEFMETGGTRTTILVAGRIAIPFGWLILALPRRGPESAVTARLDGLAASPATAPPGARERPVRPPAPSAGAPALAGQFRFRKGDKVTHPQQGEAVVARDVGLNASRMDVDFGEGDGPEPVSVDEWRRL